MGVRKIVWYRRWFSVVSLKNVQYDLPNSAVGREFVNLLSDEISSLSQGDVKSERVIVFLAVLLQRDTLVRKASDVRRLLKRRFDLWRKEQFDELIHEFQRNASSGVKKRGSKGSVADDSHRLRVFTRLMLRGQIRSAVRWLTERGSEGGVLCPSSVVGPSGETVADLLRIKHTDPCENFEEAFLECEELPPLVSVDVTGAHICHVARKIQGSGGPGGTTASQWQSFLLRFGRSSERLRDEVAELTRRLANSLVEWNMIRALLANRLIALNKNPGVRPIGIGEVLMRIMGKAMVLVVGKDVEEVCGADQLCSGLRSGIEGAIHSMRELFEERSGDGFCLLLIDARNAFNSINRTARVLWPQASRVLFNTYRGQSFMVMAGSSEFILSKEGVTQGDPLSMLMYSVAILPLIRFLCDKSKWYQNWYADVSSCVGKFLDIKEWFLELANKGPGFGYFPEPSKSMLVVHPDYVSEAESAFEGLGIKVTTGCCFLGGFVGEEKESAEFVNRKIDEWLNGVNKLSRAAEEQPRVSYVALVKSLQAEWLFLQRVVPKCANAFDVLRNRIADVFWPAVFRGSVKKEEVQLFSLPVRLG